MSALASTNQTNNDEDFELDLVATTISDLSHSPIDIPPTPSSPSSSSSGRVSPKSLSNGRVSPKSLSNGRVSPKSLSNGRVSPKSSPNGRVSPKSVSRTSFSNNLPDLSLEDSPVPTGSDSNTVPHQSFSISLESSSSEDIVDDLPKPDSARKSKISIDYDNIREKEVEDELNNFDIQRQIRASVASIPCDAQLLESIRITQGKSWLYSKLSSFRKVKKPDKSELPSLKLLDLYKFADKFDIILIIIGSIAALGVGACFPTMFYVYQDVLDNLVSYNNLQTNITGNSSNPCFKVLNDTNKTSPAANIKHVINYYVLLGFISILLSWIGWTCWIIAAERQIRRIRFLLFRNILRQEIGWFDVHNAGEFSHRLINDLDKIKDGMSEKVPDFLALLARMIGSLIYILVVGWKLALVYLSVSPLVVLAFNLTIKMIVKYTVKEVQAFALASSVAQEVLQNIRTVTSFHGQKKEEERFANNLLKVNKVGIKKGVYVGLCQAFNNIMTFSAFSIILWYGPYLVRTDCSNYTAGSVIVIFFGSISVTGSMSQLIPNIQNFAEAIGSGTYVFDMIKRQTQIDASSDEGDKPQSMTGHIEFHNVTFTYPARQETPVLTKLSLEIPSGKTVALVGSSGCGKSTIIQLIQRFYDPDNGQIKLDGKDIKTLNVAWLRSHIGIVSQEPVLFTGSIEDNIRFGKPDATDEEVQNAAKMANAHDFIMTLPDNYKTTSGDKMSGGQKQRVAIARALISNPRILLLDEATSALDNTSEKLVQDALEKAKEGRTTIVIAHRLSTIRNADLIIGLEHGEVIENGNHHELMEQKGLYYELVTAQTEKEEEVEQDSDSESEEKDDKKEHLVIRKASFARKFSRMSIFSLGNSDGFNEDAETALDDFSNNRKWFRTPFLFKIVKFNMPEWRWILLGTIVSLIFGTVNPFYGLLSAQLYGVFGVADIHEQERLARNYAILGFFVGFCGGISQFLISLCFAKSGEALTMRMRKLAFSAMLRQEMGYFEQESNSTGALVTRLSSDASALKGLTGIRAGIILQAISAATVALIFGFIASWKLTLVVLCYSPIMILSGKIRVRKAPESAKSKDKNSFVEQGGQYATQAIEHIRTVVALHQENHFINLYEHAFNQEFKKQRYQAYLLALNAAISNSTVYFLQCTCFGYGITLVQSGEINFNQMYRVLAVMSMAINSVGRCMAIIPDYSKAKAAALRIMKLHKRESKIDPNDESGIILDDVTGNIEFHDVNFRYPNRSTVRILRNFSLKCATNQTTALVGPSGSGKSTIIALLQRFYDPLKGIVLLDGHDIRVLNLRWLRSLMGLVQQEPVLFNISIRDNIAYGENSQQVTQNEIEAAAKKANIHDLIISLPEGYETLCGAKGSQLSGGQKQRIAIARALIRSPKILLLDEATSALDNKSEKVVQEALDQARIGRTCLTIAHRLSTIRHSAKIAVVNRGKMAEEGTHEQLLKENGIYAKLAIAQRRSIHKL